MSNVLTPTVVRDFVSSHQERMDERRHEWRRQKSAYMTEWWQQHGNVTQGQMADIPTQIQVETNRMYGAIETMVAAVYPKADRVVVGTGPTAGGSTKKAELAINRWLHLNRTHLRVVSAIRQAFLYDGAGIKIFVEDGPTDPIDRVKFRVLPWWEMLLDHDCYDVDDARFVGHIYSRPKAELEQQFGLTGLSGQPRNDFLASVDSENRTHIESLRAGTGRNASADMDNSAFVKVLELVNFVDDHESGYKGRLDIYLLDQGTEYDEPIRSLPLPFAKRSGEPLSHIQPLIFKSEPEYPYRGYSHAKRLYPQCQELNVSRSYKANTTRRDARMWLTLDGLLSDDQKTMMTAGVDGLVLEVDASKLQGRSIQDALQPVRHNPISPNIDSWSREAEFDLQRAQGPITPNAYGEPMRTSATEVLALKDYSDSEMGQLAAVKDGWMSSFCQVFLRAIIAAMVSPADSIGGEEDTQYEQGDSEGRAGFLDTGETSSDDGQEKNDDDQEDSEPAEAAEPAGEDEAGQEPAEDQPGDTNADTGPEELRPEEIPPETIKIREGPDIIEITVEDLDGDFIIEVASARQTPFSEAATRQALLQLSKPLLELWNMAQEGGPMSVLARAQMVAFVEKFDLPPDMHPDNLEQELQAQAEKEGQGPKVVPFEKGQAGGPPMPPGGPPMPPGGPPGPPQAAAAGAGPAPLPKLGPEEILALPPSQAIEYILAVNAGRDQQLHETLVRAKELPEEAQREIIAELVG